MSTASSRVFKVKIDVSNAASLERDIVAAIPNTTAGLILELSEVDYMDSSGIRMLFLLHNQLEQRGQRVRAVVPDTTPIKHVLDCLGVDALIPLTQSCPPRWNSSRGNRHP